MKVLITGITGMLGMDIAGVLGSEYDISGVARGNKKYPDSLLKSPLIKADITNQAWIKQIILDIKPDIIINTAALANVDECEINKQAASAVNKDAVRYIASACEEISAVFIHISTDYVFDGAQNIPYKHTDNTNPLNYYGITKLDAENIIQDICQKYFIIRSSLLYGAHGNNFIQWVLDSSHNNVPISLIDNQIGSPTYTYDLAAAIKKIIDNIRQARISAEDYGIYHITNAGMCSRFEHGMFIVEHAKISGENITKVKAAQIQRPAKRPAYSVLDNQRIKQRFALDLRDWKDATKEYLFKCEMRNAKREIKY